MAKRTRDHAVTGCSKHAQHGATLLPQRALPGVRGGAGISLGRYKRGVTTPPIELRSLLRESCIITASGKAFSFAGTPAMNAIGVVVVIIVIIVV